DKRLTERVTLQGHKAAVQAAAFSPDGRFLVTGGADRSVRVWELPTGKKMYELEGLLTGVGHLTLAPDGRHLAAAGPHPLVPLVPRGGPRGTPVAQEQR